MTQIGPFRPEPTAHQLYDQPFTPIQTPMNTEEIFEQLKHPNPNLRDEAMWSLADQYEESPNPAIITRLMNALDDEDVTYRRCAVKTLGALGADTIPYTVEGMLNSENVTVRGSCAKALAQVAVMYRDQLFPQIGLDGLKAAMQDENPVVHIAATMALGEIGTPAIDIFEEALKATENIGLAVSIVNSLGAIKDDRAAELLKQIAANESLDTYVREMAESALSRSDLVRNYQRNT
jgi:bilin biosynthesis protein